MLERLGAGHAAPQPGVGFWPLFADLRLCCREFSPSILLLWNWEVLLCACTEQMVQGGKLPTAEEVGESRAVPSPAATLVKARHLKAGKRAV